MEGLDYWRLCDELCVVHAALLIVGIDPSGEIGAYCDQWPIHQQPYGYHAAKSALIHAVQGRRLKATIKWKAYEKGFAEDSQDDWPLLHSEDVGFHPDDYPMIGAAQNAIRAIGIVYRPEPDWYATTVQVDALREWLKSRGIGSGFFFPLTSDAPDYLDPQNSRFAPKLAAAVRAWLAVTDPGAKSPKQALDKWLRENAASFGLTDDDGNPINTAIEECSKVANWQPGGGVPKTPGG